jgi:Zn-dependent protease with chaperone function
MIFSSKRLSSTADISSGSSASPKKLRRFLRIAVILLGAYMALMVASEILARQIPDEWEVSLSKLPSASPAAESAEDSALLETPRRLFGKITEGERLRDLPYHIKITDMSSGPNAFALPGGSIGVTRSLLSKLKTDEGLAFVLAHELAHHEKRHITRHTLRKMLLNSVLMVLGSDASSSGLVAVSSTTETTYSRAQEAEADAYAAHLIAKKFPNPENCVEFLELDHIRSSSAPGWLGWLGTHPPPSSRVENIKKITEAYRQPGK